MISRAQNNSLSPYNLSKTKQNTYTRMYLNINRAKIMLIYVLAHLSGIVGYLEATLMPESSTSSENQYDIASLEFTDDIIIMPEFTTKKNMQ